MYPRLWRELVLPSLRTPGSLRNKLRMVSTERFHASASSEGREMFLGRDRVCGAGAKLFAGNSWGNSHRNRCAPPFRLDCADGNLRVILAEGVGVQFGSSGSGSGSPNNSQMNHSTKSFAFVSSPSNFILMVSPLNNHRRCVDFVRERIQICNSQIFLCRFE
jgi:hypothetical protein